MTISEHDNNALLAIHVAVTDLKERLIGASGDGGVVAKIEAEIERSREVFREHEQSIAAHDRAIDLLIRDNEHRDKRCDVETKAIEEEVTARCELGKKVAGLHDTKLKVLGIVIGVGLASGGTVAVASNVIQGLLGK